MSALKFVAFSISSFSSEISLNISSLFAAIVASRCCLFRYCLVTRKSQRSGCLLISLRRTDFSSSSSICTTSVPVRSIVADFTMRHLFNFCINRRHHLAVVVADDRLNFPAHFLAYRHLSLSEFHLFSVILLMVLAIDGHARKVSSSATCRLFQGNHPGCTGDCAHRLVSSSPERVGIVHNILEQELHRHA